MKLYAAALDFGAIVEEFSLHRDFPTDVERAAGSAVDRFADSRVDCREFPFVTIDPPGSMDLDQAVHITATSEGWRLRYAIADVAAFVAPQGPIAAESLHRGQTIYVPDEPIRLHPPQLSEGVASLLPDVDRPCVLWDISVDAAGEVQQFTVFRALIRSVARFDYAEVQRDWEAGTLHPAIVALPDLGRARQGSKARREALNLRLPVVRVERSDDAFALVVEPRELMNDFNAELSLLAGMCAGQMMVEAGMGLLRTLPPASAEDVQRFDRDAAALGYPRGGSESVGELLARVDVSTVEGLAVMRDAAGLLRGSGYQQFGFVGGDAVLSIHAGIGGWYAHVTAPLRRLGDRYATEICLSIAAGVEVPAWVVEDLDAVVESMSRSSALASAVDKACLRFTEAKVLQPWVGHHFSVVVLEGTKQREDAVVQRVFVLDPPLMADCVSTVEGEALALGETVQATLILADPVARRVRFAWPAD